MKTPYYYQQKVIDWAADKDKIPLFIQMRLGKTLITIRWAKAKNPNRVLVVCPKTVIPTWINELKDENIEPLLINTKFNRIIGDAIAKMPGWFVTNYETITFSEISKQDWDVVILDESTKIRIIGNKITTKCCNDFKDVPCKAILAGKPNPESMFDYFNQFKFLYGDCLGFESYYEFVRRFSSYGEPTGYAKRMMAAFVAENAYYLTRDQVHVGSKKVFSERYCELEPDAKSAYQDFEGQWFNEDFDTKWAIVAYNYMHQMAGGLPQDKQYKSYHKVNEIYDMLKEEVPNEQVVIWCRFTGEIDLLAQRLIDRGISTGIINGQVTGENRETVRVDFQKGNYQVIVAQIKCASMGVDLSASDTVFYYSNSFSNLDRQQSEDRVIHPEKEQIISFTDFITADTIDVDIHMALKDKEANSEAFLHNVYDKMKERRLGNYVEQSA